MKERVDILLKRASSPGSVISSWEQGFLESVQRQLSSKSPRALSSKQLDIVHRVEAKVEKDLRGDSEFKAQWTDEKASDFKTACDYYNAALHRTAVPELRSMAKFQKPTPVRH